MIYNVKYIYKLQWQCIKLDSLTNIAFGMLSVEIYDIFFYYGNTNVWTYDFMKRPILILK